QSHRPRILLPFHFLDAHPCPPPWPAGSLRPPASGESPPPRRESRRNPRHGPDRRDESHLRYLQRNRLPWPASPPESILRLRASTPQSVPANTAPPSASPRPVSTIRSSACRRSPANAPAEHLRRLLEKASRSLQARRCRREATAAGRNDISVTGR